MKTATSPIATITASKKTGASPGGVMRQTVRRAGEGHLSVASQLFEMLILKLGYGLGPGHYHRARYWRKSLPWHFKTGFWPYYEFRQAVRLINPPHYQKLSQNKLCEKALLQLGGIPTARFLGRLHYQSNRSLTDNRLSAADEIKQLLLAQPEIDRLCFKMVEGYGGQGFRAVARIPGEHLKLRLLDSGQVVSVSEFLSVVLAFDEGGDFVIEEYIQQHPELARFNPSSVNTLRIWVSCIDGETDVIDTFLRVGGSGSLVDNTSMGAHIFRVDLNSGVIGDGVDKSIYNNVFQCHRDSGERISGGTLPFWDEALNLARKAVLAFPHIGFAGVDIAITSNGPVVIELNVEPDPTSAIIFDRCHRELFEVFKSIAPH